MPTDFVTFCGLSNYGNPSPNETLTPVLPFAVPPGTTCSNATSGAADNGVDQFDGIVGRLSHPHTAAVPSLASTTVDCLSIVGGVRQDALFGIADLDSFVGRTDGTGPVVLPPGGPAGGYPTPNAFGGSTPQCALLPFGHQIGVSDPQIAPAMPRMLLDWEGPPPGPGVTFSLVMSRHPRQTASALSIVALQLGFPGTAGGFAPVPLPGGAELWVPQFGATLTAAPNSYWEAIRFPLTLPATPTNGILTIQVVCLLVAPVTGGAFPACADASLYAATPGLWMSY